MSNIFFLLFAIAIIVFAIVKTIYYFIEKRKIFESCRQVNSFEIRKLSGSILIDGTYRKRWEWCTFDLLINENSIFLFTAGFSLVPLKIINLLFSNKDKKIHEILYF